MKESELETKTMYSVEKFLPSECPKCRHKFDRLGVDWTRLFGDMVDGKKVIRKTDGYLIIVCSHCNNFTASIPLESYLLSDPEAARNLLEQGFVNFQEVEAGGNMTRDSHMVCTKFPDVHVL